MQELGLKLFLPAFFTSRSCVQYCIALFFFFCSVQLCPLLQTKLAEGYNWHRTCISSTGLPSLVSKSGNTRTLYVYGVIFIYRLQCGLFTSTLQTSYFITLLINRTGLAGVVLQTGYIFFYDLTHIKHLKNLFGAPIFHPISTNDSYLIILEIFKKGKCINIS